MGVIAVILHVAFLSMHVTAAFERSLQTDSVAVGDYEVVHAFCLTDGSGGPYPGSTDPADDRPASGNCPVCASLVAPACLASPDFAYVPVVFPRYAPLRLSVALPPSRPELRAIGSIRGPPVIV